MAAKKKAEIIEEIMKEKKCSKKEAGEIYKERKATAKAKKENEKKAREEAKAAEAKKVKDEAVKAIMEEKGVSLETAEDIYKAQTEKADRLAGKGDGGGSSSEVVPAKPAPKKNANFADKDVAEVVNFLNGQRLPKGNMVAYVNERLGKEFDMHVSNMNQKECWFTYGDIRVPSEGIIIIKA